MKDNKTDKIIDKSIEKLRLIYLGLLILFVLAHIIISITSIVEVKDNNNVFQVAEDKYVVGSYAYLFAFIDYNFFCFIGGTCLILIAVLILLSIYKRKVKVYSYNAKKSYKKSLKKNNAKSKLSTDEIIDNFKFDENVLREIKEIKE